MTTTNQRIKEVRLKLGLSQAKFAESISISNGYIAAIELGNREVNDRLIKLISATFNVRENWLKNGEGDMLIEESLDSDFQKFKELNSTYKQFIRNQINQLLTIQQNENKLN